ncbi:MAG: type II toxin-antitoxin system RelE/ParE family toxin [Paracoccaceae bacterium]|nr:type II toxin-antitoxin system RelE/ParE family toxin [Paracoccaceae bacterium]MDE2914999.1 type II toxin-antitoxin system RelE/ParE family toxin [Paracoccaceae bacterium]
MGIEFHDTCHGEFDDLSRTGRDSIFAKVKLLAKDYPDPKQPYSDTLNGSGHTNLNGLRRKAEDGVWRGSPLPSIMSGKAILTAAGDKAGYNEMRFYRNPIARSDERFDQHLELQERRKWWAGP